LTPKAMSVPNLKLMTEDELLAELRNVTDKADAQMIMAELLKPNWTLVAGYWAVIAGVVVMVIVVLFYQSYWL